MELTKKELGYLELYKGNDKGIEYIYPDVNEDMRWWYASDYNYRNINGLINFVSTKNPALLQNLEVWKMDDMIDMIFTLTDVACRYAMEKPQILRPLYRMEYKDNMDNYNDSMVSSFKSTSKSNSEVLTFAYNDHFGLKFAIDGYVPYIDIDEIVSTSVFSDEREIIFPPFIHGSFTGERDSIHGYEYLGVKLQDGFENDYENPERYKYLYEQIKSNFINEVNTARKSGVISSDLESYCDVIRSYLYTTIRQKYNSYAAIYNKENNKER